MADTVTLRFTGICAFSDNWKSSTNAKKKDKPPRKMKVALSNGLYDVGPNIHLAPVLRFDCDSVKGPFPKGRPLMSFKSPKTGKGKLARDGLYLLKYETLEIDKNSVTDERLKVTESPSFGEGLVPNERNRNDFRWVVDVSETRGRNRFYDRDCFKNPPSAAVIARIDLTRGVLSTDEFIRDPRIPNEIGRPSQVVLHRYTRIGEARDRAVASTVKCVIKCKKKGFRITSKFWKRDDDPTMKLPAIDLTFEPGAEIEIWNAPVYDLLASWGAELPKNYGPGESFLHHYRLLEGSGAAPIAETCLSKEEERLTNRLFCKGMGCNPSTSY